MIATLDHENIPDMTVDQIQSSYNNVQKEKFHLHKKHCEIGILSSWDLEDYLLDPH